MILSCLWIYVYSISNSLKKCKSLLYINKNQNFGLNALSTKHPHEGVRLNDFKGTDLTITESMGVFLLLEGIKSLVRRSLINSTDFQKSDVIFLSENVDVCEDDTKRVDG